MKHLPLILTIFLSSSILLFCQRVPRGFIDYQRNSPNCPLSFGVTNTGIIGCDTSKTDIGLEFPRGSGNSYLFNAGIMYGSALQDTADRAMAITSYDDYSVTSWMLPHLPASVTDSLEYAKVYFSTDYDNQGQPKKGKGYNYPVWKTTYDKKGRWVDTPSERIPSSVLLQPATHSHEDIVCKYDDLDSSRYVIRDWIHQPRYAMNIVTEQHIYSFFSGPLENALIVRCRLINAGNIVYGLFAAGATMDPDIGKVTNNDYCRKYKKDTTLNFLYGWSGPDSSRLGYIGLGIIDSPYYDSASLRVRTTKTEHTLVAPIVGCTGSFPRTRTDTVTTDEIHHKLFSKQRDSINRSDIRFHISTGGVNVMPKDTFEFAYAIVLAMPSVKQQADGSAEDVEDLVQLFRRCKAAYKIFTETGIINEVQEQDFHESTDVLAYPSPADSRISIVVHNGKSYEKAEFYDYTGRLCGEQFIQEAQPLLDVSHYPNGIYRIVLRSATGANTSFSHAVIH